MVDASNKFTACFAPNGHVRFKLGAAWPANKYEGFFKSSNFCGLDGRTPILSFPATSSFTYFDFDNNWGATTNVGYSGTTGSRTGLNVASGPVTCSCGTSLMPTDGCASLPSADIKSKCIATSDG